ncbi:unnamed protein product [Ilex paraguariensis]|uniref:Uncharacterized protein n=1 Tax=Ilex paraguariensis TaxID=185542 RepID=A0ABC8SFQ3_9AQUA
MGGCFLNFLLMELKRRPFFVFDATLKWILNSGSRAESLRLETTIYGERKREEEKEKEKEKEKEN